MQNRNTVHHMLKRLNRLSLWSYMLAGFLFVFSSTALLYNHQVTHYIGNEYVRPSLYYLVIPLILMWTGLKVLDNPYPRISKSILSALKLYLFLCLMVYLTHAVQYTPFPTIDHQLIALDRLLYFDTTATLTWTYKHPLIQSLLSFSYGLLNSELILVCCLIILFPNDSTDNVFYFLMLFTAMVGFLFYYLFPTTAPASHFKHPFFYQEQYDTGKKFYEIHHYLTPTTLEGGMIGMPSFHTVWAFICQLYLRRFTLLWFTVLPINLFIMLACVMLGWHYLVDVLAAILLTALAYTLSKAQIRT